MFVWCINFQGQQNCNNYSGTLWPYLETIRKWPSNKGGHSLRFYISMMHKMLRLSELQWNQNSMTLIGTVIFKWPFNKSGHSREIRERWRRETGGGRGREKRRERGFLTTFFKEPHILMTTKNNDSTVHVLQRSKPTRSIDKSKSRHTYSLSVNSSMVMFL